MLTIEQAKQINQNERKDHERQKPPLRPEAPEKEDK